MPVRRDASAGANLCYGEAGIGAGALQMSQDRVQDVRRLLSELGGQMPMSEAEFRYRVEPLRLERENSVRALIDLLDEAATHDLAVSALHEIAGPSDADLLVSGFRDADRSERARAEIAQVLTAVAADQLHRWLSAEEIQCLSLLSINTLLERLRDRAGLEQVIELYRGSARSERRALLDAVGVATQRPRARLRLGAALDPLFSHEPDEALRALMIRRVAERSEPASARALSRWLGHAHGAERRRVLEALRRLGHLGLRPAARSLEAWVSGVDATGSFNVGVSFPAALDLRDIVLGCISVEAGLRAVNVITTVAAQTGSEISRALEEGQSIPVAPIDVSSALRHIEAARRRTLDLGRPLPDGYALAAPYLRRPVAVAKRSQTPSASRRPSQTHLAALLDVPPYTTWGFGEADLRLPPGLEQEEQALSSRRLRAAARSALRALERTAVEARLVAMLKHQSEIHRLRSESQLAARSLAAAREIEEHGAAASAFARRLVERSVAARLIRGQRTPRAEVRDVFKRTIEDRLALRRRAVAVLDLAEVLYRQLENLAERVAPSARLTLAQMEAVALAGAELCATEFSRDASEQTRLPGMERSVRVAAAVVRGRVRADASRLRLERSLEAAIGSTVGTSPETAKRLAAALVSAARWFAGEICLRRCGRGCLQEPEADGRALFFSRDHPAGLELAPAGSGAPRRRTTSAVALRQHLSQRLDRRIALSTAFLEALTQLGAPVRGEARSRRRRTEELLQRLRTMRLEVERIEEDPAWLYSLIEESEPLLRELDTLHRHQLGAALGGLSPNAAQFSSFQPYPQAHAAWRRFERQVRRLGLMGLPLRALHDAADRLESSSTLLALLRAVAEPLSSAALDRLGEALDEFWIHTPRSALESRTPAQAGALPRTR